MSQVLDGTVVRDQILEKLKPRIARLGRVPGLAVVLAGSDPASEQYVKNKILACEKLGIYSEKITPPAHSSTDDMLRVIDQVNRNPKIDGILVQMPLPQARRRRAACWKPSLLKRTPTDSTRSMSATWSPAGPRRGPAPPPASSKCSSIITSQWKAAKP